VSICVADVLDFLVSKGATPSNLGAQLERMRDGTTSGQDPFRARDEVEAGMMRLANVIRCVDEFECRPELSPRGQAIEKINKHVQIEEGRIALGVLRAYHERPSSPERGLVEIYKFLARIAPRAVPSIPKECEDLLQAFRDGDAKRCRFVAAETYADALLGLQSHVRIYDRRQSNIVDIR
jgi:hypothetical protein